MEKLETGSFHGENIGRLSIKGLVVSLNRYPGNSQADWHYHENPHFTFILRGSSLEKRKKTAIQCVPGTLLFYQPHEPHCNQRYLHGSRNLSIEIEEQWLKKFGLTLMDIQSDPVVACAPARAGFTRILSELKLNDGSSALSIEAWLLQSLAAIKRKKSSTTDVPSYLLRAKELLHDHIVDTLSLPKVSRAVNVHPVTLSREFPKYFHCTIGDYSRNLRIERSLHLLARKSLGIDEVAFQCGFYDVSHFSKVFKKYTGLTPAKYRCSL